jgi:hypothetical protein
VADATEHKNTAVKTVATRPGANGGTLLTGNPGNKGGTGRPPKALIEWAKEIINDPAIQDVYAARAKAGDLKVFEFAAERAEGKAKELKEISGDIRVTVLYDEDAPRAG